MKDPKVKAFLCAFQALFSSEDDDDKDNAHQEQENTDECNQDEDEDLHSFLSMVGSLKE
jgi:hypothetical protein